MALYFIRHGQSEANLINVFAGRSSDSPLTELGRQQALLAAQQLKNTPVDRIICSPLTRAHTTAQIIAEHLDVSDLSIDERILEYETGWYTGKSEEGVTSLMLTSCEGAEDPQAFQDRVLSFMRQYKDSDEVILVVCHAGVFEMLEATKQGLEPKLFTDAANVPNATPIELDLSWLS